MHTIGVYCGHSQVSVCTVRGKLTASGAAVDVFEGETCCARTSASVTRAVAATAEKPLKLTMMAIVLIAWLKLELYL